MRKINFTLKFSLISVLIIVFFAFLSSLALVFFLKSQTVLEHTSNKIVAEVSSSVDTRVESLIQPIDHQVSLEGSTMRWLYHIMCRMCSTNEVAAPN